MKKLTRILSATASADVIDAAAMLLRGKIGVVPTDTIHGISGIVSPEQKRKILSAKGYSEDRPLIILASRPSQVIELLHSKRHRQILSIYRFFFLEGANTGVTIVAESSSAGRWLGQTVGVRFVVSGTTADLLDMCGPLFSTSYNLAGENYLTPGRNLLETISARPPVDFVLIGKDHGPLPSLLISIEDFPSELPKDKEDCYQDTMKRLRLLRGGAGVHIDRVFKRLTKALCSRAGIFDSDNI